MSITICPTKERITIKIANLFGRIEFIVFHMEMILCKSGHALTCSLEKT